nr:MAG TPA: hypothetical protein [Bacteriophage sp.]
MSTFHKIKILCKNVIILIDNRSKRCYSTNILN